MQRSSKVLDVGCGVLRGGYWLINWLDRGRYFGIEPNKEMVEFGVKLVGPEVIEEKRPQIMNNDDFRFGGFGERFDYVVARSVWTHAAKWMISRMLDEFKQSSTPGAKFLTSYIPPSFLHGEYKGDEWLGRSHTSSSPGIARHSLGWIRSECKARGLSVTELPAQMVNGQEWISIQTPGP